MGKTLVPAQDPETGSPGVLSPGAVISPATTASETITLEPIITAEDEAAMAQGDAMMMGQFTKSRAGSYREGTLRCILDIAETYPDRPAGMHDIARGQCRSLSEDPRRARSFGDKTAKGKPRSFRLMDTIRETRLGEDLPITHVLFLPKEETARQHQFRALESRIRRTRRLPQSLLLELRHHRLHLWPMNRQKGHGGADAQCPG